MKMFDCVMLTQDFVPGFPCFSIL